MSNWTSMAFRASMNVHCGRYIRGCVHVQCLLQMLRFTLANGVKNRLWQTHHLSAWLQISYARLQIPVRQRLQLHGWRMCPARMGGRVRFPPGVNCCLRLYPPQCLLVTSGCGACARRRWTWRRGRSDVHQLSD